MSKILIIEDDSFLAAIFFKQLEKGGFEVSTAGSGEDGLKLIEKDLPDLLVLDLMLPKMNGFEVLEQLKSADETKKIPVLIMSNLGQREDIDKCLALGAAEYLIKAHVTPDELAGKAKGILKK
jgi:DNA-binding response OmpR family regulator